MTEALEKTLDLPPADQIGFVVKDLEASIAQYDALFGPFKTMDGSVEAANYRGHTRDASLKLAFGQSGDLEIELIEWTGGDSPHREFIEAGREGMHHIRFRVDNCQQRMRDAESIGFTPIWHKKIMDGLEFAYMEREGDPLLIEFLEMPEDMVL